MLFFLSILLNYMTQNVSSVTQKASLTGGLIPLILRGGASPINDRFPYPLIYLKPEKGIRLWRPPARKVKRVSPPLALANFARYG